MLGTLGYALRTLRVTDIVNIEGTRCIPYCCLKHYFKAAPVSLIVRAIGALFLRKLGTIYHILRDTYEVL